MIEEQTYHIPVLLNESINAMAIQKDGIYVDVTFGGGGHSKEILKHINLQGGGHLYSFDQDKDAENNIVKDSNFTFVRSNFRYLDNFLKYYKVEKVDSILADLGVSSHHFDDSKRGFSFRFDSDLDMRMNTRSKQTAADILNLYSEEKLSDVFYYYGELKNSKRIAKNIIKKRSEKEIKTIQDFLQVLSPLFSKEKEKKNYAKAFQALRIEVNHEMDALKEMLKAATKVLKPGGRLVVITYHSLEDRIVKNIIKRGNVEGQINKDFYGNFITSYKTINNKVILPTDEEIVNNPRARSAKLRIAEKI